jgi:dihydrofolate reductase
MLAAMDFPKPIYLVVAVARNGVIGRAGRLPWDLPEDWRHFLELTCGGILVHGRKCQDHHGLPLPDRAVIVLSGNPAYHLPGAQVARSLSEALALAQASPQSGPIWIGGGAAIYREALPLAGRVYLTEIHQDFEGDTFLPLELFTRAGFARVLEERPVNSGPVPCTFKVLARTADAVPSP